MEKLKAKHDHTLTDILKVLIFAIVLLIPGFMFLPSMLYFGFNEQANAPVKQVQIQEDIKVDFNQKGKIQFSTGFGGITKTDYSSYMHFEGTITEMPTGNRVYGTSIGGVFGHIFLIDLRISGTTTNTGGTLPYITDGYIGNNCNITTGHLQTRTNGNQNNLIPCLYCGVVGDTISIDVAYEYFDLTQMFGTGNEPTISEFNQWFTNTYYPYTESEEVVLTINGSTEEVVDITTQLEWNWEQIWQRPILSWTKYSILKQGLDAFTNVFGVLQTSYITNLITYELIMVAIYIVIDIVLAMFKWLTHLIGTK